MESTFLSRLHDLCGNETRAPDGIHLVPAGLENIVGVKSQQYAFQCNALEKEIKLVSTKFYLQQHSLQFWSALLPTQSKIHPAVRTLQNF